MATNQQLACGYCGVSVGPQAYTIQTTRPDPRDVRRYLQPGDYRPYAVRQMPIAVALCAECRPLRRYADRSVWNTIVGKPVADEYTDDELHKAGASLIRPIFELRREISAPQLPWAHVREVDARIALAALRLPNRDHRRPHKSNSPCGSCGVLTSEGWLGRTIAGYACCLDCGEGMLAANAFAQGRRIKSLLSTELKLSSSTPAVFGDVLRAWADTDRQGTSERWGYVSAAERERIRAHLVAIGYPLVTEAMKAKYAKPKTPAPVAVERQPVGAVGV